MTTRERRPDRCLRCHVALSASTRVWLRYHKRWSQLYRDEATTGATWRGGMHDAGCCAYCEECASYIETKVAPP